MPEIQVWKTNSGLETPAEIIQGKVFVIVIDGKVLVRFFPEQQVFHLFTVTAPTLGIVKER